MNRLKLNIICLVGAMVLSMAGSIVCVNKGSTIGIWIAGALPFVCLIPINILYVQRNKRIKKATKDVLIYNSESFTLTVYKKVPQIKKQFYLENLQTTEHSYTPEKLVYTSVSSGGVTTGGFHVEGGASSRKMYSDRCKLFFCDSPEAMWGSPVKKIILSDKLLAQAKNSPIKQHIIDDCLMIEKPMNANWAIANAQTYGIQHHNTLNAYEKTKVEQYLTYAEAYQILNWLSGIQ